jgi:hypothetical protein
LRIEAKSYQSRAKDVLQRAYAKLGQDDFFPDPDTIAFRLRRPDGQPELKAALEDLQANGRGGAEIALLLFAMHENEDGRDAIRGFVAPMMPMRRAGDRSVNQGRSEAVRERLDEFAAVLSPPDGGSLPSNS